MHPVTLAPFPILALTTFVLFHPRPIPVGLELVCPNLPEIIFIDISLMVVRADAGASGDGSVNQDRADSHSCLAREEMVPDIAFVVPKEALTTITGVNAAFLACLLNEIEHPTVHFSRKLKVWVQGGATGRKD